MKSSAEEKDQLAAICQGLGVSMGVAQALRKEWFSFWNGAASLDGLNQMGNDFTSDPAYVYEQGLLLRGIATAVENLPARERNLILRYLGLRGNSHDTFGNWRYCSTTTAPARRRRLTAGRWRS